MTLLLRTCLLMIAMALPWLAGGAAPAMAQVPTNTAPLEFRDAHEQARFHALSEELRCVMCQNQSLADSNAQIARDLRVEVLNLMRQGKTDAEVKQFLVQRYGEFVLYKPPMTARTWLLWFGPLVLVLIGAVVVVRIVRSRQQATPAAIDTPRPDAEEW